LKDLANGHQEDQVKVDKNQNYVELTGDFLVLSSAPLNGGLRETSRIVNHSTDPGNEGPVGKYLREKLMLGEEELEEVVGFVTAADVSTAFVEQAELRDGRVVAAITAGVGDPVDPRYHNTINVIVFTDLNLSPTGLANMFIVITEAKVAALQGLEVVKNGEELTGTPTDAIAVARPRESDGAEIDYSGTATELGEYVYNLVEKGVKQSLATNNGYSPGRNILARLSERGISTDDIVESAFQLLAGDVGDERELEEKFSEILESYAGDPNVHALVSTGFYLEKEKNRMELDGDPGRLVADELIGIDIAEYIGGKNALFNFIRYDRNKPGILADLPPFLDDAIGGLIAGAMTRLFEERP